MAVKTINTIIEYSELAKIRIKNIKEDEEDKHMNMTQKHRGRKTTKVKKEDGGKRGKSRMIKRD